MKASFGQYAKVIILVFVVMGLLGFVLGMGSDSFSGQMQVTKPEADYGKEDNGALLDDIAAREKPVITVTRQKLKQGQYVNFIDFAKAKFQDANAKNQKLYVKKITMPNGTVEEDLTILANLIRVSRGTYTVTYRAEETYKGTKLTKELEAKFIVDKN